MTASPASLQMVNSGSQPISTLTVEAENMDTAGATVEWSVEPEGIVKLNDTGNEFQKIAAAVAPGTVTIKATVKAQNGSGIESNTASIVVRPCFTTVEIKPVAPSVTVAAGQTVQAIVNVSQNTGSYAPADDARLSYKWYWYHDSANKNQIEDETGRTCKIPTEFHDTTGSLYLYVAVYDNGRPAQNAAGETLSGYAPLLSGDDALLALDKAALTLENLGVSSTTITAETTLKLPDKGANGSKITWESRDPSVIDPTTGKVTLPIEGEQEVTLTAKLTLNGKTAELPITFVVKSKTAQAVDADKETLENAAKSLSTLYPRFGKDSNVQTMVETRLAKEFPNVGVTYTGKTPQNATANGVHSDISDNGNITYFYTDLTTTDLTTTLQRFDTYKASFMLTCGKETKAVEIPVIVYWDADKVRDFMTKEVLNQTTLPEQTTEALMLPTSGKWTTISWTSSDPTIIANDGTITRSTIDQQAVLTATFTFNFTSDVTGNEQLIVLYKTFEVTVKGNADAADRAALYQQKLDDALAAPGLKDFVTGEKLTEENGVYAVRNDIQFPTTRDLKIDGKYTPVVITSSDSGVIEAPTTPNSARVWVYRPLPGEAAKTVTLTVKILDRPNGPQPGDDLSAMRGVLASEEIKVTVQPLTQTEIDAEIALMERVKDAYWNGICNANVERDNVTTDLHAFQECYLDTDDSLTWVYDREDLKNHGIVPVPLDNWYDQQIWRLFRSSNAEVIAHENLLVTRQGDSKAVTITSYLSSETLGRYAEKYPQNADFQKLYKQPVTADLVVTGTQYAQGNNEGRVEAAKRARAARPTVTVSFSLSGRGMGFPEESNLKYAEGSTVYDVFSDRLAKHRYTCKRRGSYIAAITSDSGVTLEEFDEGKNSGWMYRVNGELAGKYMSAQGLKDGDRIELYFTSDWTSESGAEGWQKPGKTETVTNADGSTTKTETKPDGTTVETTTKPDGSTTVAETKPDGSVSTVEKRADGTEIKTAQPASGGITASVSVPKSVGSTRVDIPVSKPSGSMVAVIVHPDGTEEIVRGSVVTETGIALRAEGDVRLKIIDNAKRFNDMADHWAKDAVEFASSRELFNGVGNDAFGPDRSMTRGMVSTVLARLAGADTAGGETWYAKGTVWAVENGISDGTAPEQPVTREQLAAMLYRYAGSPAVSGELSFDDTTVISIWAYDAVRWCVDNGILNGVGGNRMTPQDLAQRGQVAAMLMRFLQATV
ncbi:MAG: immunoglobulin-like domain-containing protein [Oscillospiraceae bacterium]|nr:immunoglobulin-like domain-containing protein [Oscillospiraceae bacterium]